VAAVPGRGGRGLTRRRVGHGPGTVVEREPNGVHPPGPAGGLAHRAGRPPLAITPVPRCPSACRPRRRPEPRPPARLGRGPGLRADHREGSLPSPRTRRQCMSAKRKLNAAHLLGSPAPWPPGAGARAGRSVSPDGIGPATERRFLLALGRVAGFRRGHTNVHRPPQDRAGLRYAAGRMTRALSSAAPGRPARPGGGGCRRPRRLPPGG
jgi:hypothetical protein